MSASTTLNVLERNVSITQNTTRKLLHVLEEYKALELQGIVYRQSALHRKTYIENMMEEVDDTTNRQQSLIEEAAQIPVSSMRDVMDCFALWYADVIANSLEKNVKPVDHMLKNMFIYLHEHQF
ncbi:MAG: hypothetical protein COA43_10595 [Robiginitomaculum sp.]|nr:MAG: hypothetical protein COA43_10595 [Robiginitomaculum sp.]